METRSTVVVRGLFGTAGLVAGVVGGWYALDATSSWALALFVFLITMQVVGRAIPDVITDPEKGRRIVFFGLPPIAAVGALLGSYQIWATWWVAAVIGLAGYLIGYGVAYLAFPRIAAEEDADSKARMGLRPSHARAERRDSPTLSLDNAIRLLDAAEQQGVKLSLAERRRFLDLVEASQVEQALDMIAERLGERDAARPTLRPTDKYANTKF
jgi:hypothetical protein